MPSKVKTIRVNRGERVSADIPAYGQPLICPLTEEICTPRSCRKNYPGVWLGKGERFREGASNLHGQRREAVRGMVDSQTVEVQSPQFAQAVGKLHGKQDDHGHEVTCFSEGSIIQEDCPPFRRLRARH